MMNAKDTAHQHVRDLLFLFGAPIVIVIIVIVALVMSHLFAHPKYSFIYCSGYGCQSDYSVSPAGTLMPAYANQQNTPYLSSLYLYDTTAGSAQLLTPEQAAQYHLDPSSKSPDGYTLQNASNGSSFLIWSDYSDGYVLKDGVATKPVTLPGSDTSINLIGWVQHE